MPVPVVWLLADAVAHAVDRCPPIADIVAIAFVQALLPNVGVGLAHICERELSMFSYKALHTWAKMATVRAPRESFASALANGKD